MDTECSPPAWGSRGHANEMPFQPSAVANGRSALPISGRSGLVLVVNALFIPNRDESPHGEEQDGDVDGEEVRDHWRGPSRAAVADLLLLRRHDAGRLARGQVLRHEPGPR
ncbi:hypothetical protein GCM10022625_39810 [Deinococcus aetherius]